MKQIFTGSLTEGARAIRESMAVMTVSTKNEDVKKFPMQPQMAKQLLNKIFGRHRGLRKPDDLEDALQSEMVDGLSPEEANAIASLPIVKVSADFSFADDPGAKGAQYYVLQIGKDSFLVDTQGYDYPRYVLRMPTTTKRGLKDKEGAASGDKDVQRILDMKTKSGGNEAKIIQLATQMAKAINSRTKAQRRADAAKKVLDGKLGDKVAQIFLDKVPMAANESVAVPEDAEVFYVLVVDGDKEATVKVSRSGGKWREQIVDGDKMNINLKSYQSYLKPRDILSWFKKDFEHAEFTNYEE